MYLRIVFGQQLLQLGLGGVVVEVVEADLGGHGGEENCKLMGSTRGTPSFYSVDGGVWEVFAAFVVVQIVPIVKVFGEVAPHFGPGNSE